MKKLFFNLITLTMFFNLSAQDKVFDKSGSSAKVKQSRYSLILKSQKNIKFDSLQLSNKQAAGFFGTLAPIAIDAVFTSIEKYLDKRAKSFVGEYEASNSYKEFYEKDLPNIHFKRTGIVKNSDTTLLSIELKAVQPKKEYPLAYYYVNSLELSLSKARTKSGKSTLDYSIEITPYFLKVKQETTGGNVKIEPAEEVKIDPIKITGVDFGITNGSDKNDKHKYRTGLFTIPAGHLLAGVKLKIIESNPTKIEAEKVLALYNEYKDDAKTVVNYFLPESKDSEDTDKTAEQASSPTGTVSNKK
ncbi:MULTISPECIES: hypothetical protein [Flavobacteriaceae]|uniref:hypothetical protein n=1 Tax=Flavobacteriaceae TaxID=49546 RepID=UPI00234B7DCA|nr:hypothetical protein [Muricauda sp. SP22]MDC6362550.1 hypothetical protein [Muricauda sp. SP22]